MNTSQHSKNFLSFVFGEYFLDALRNTVVIVLPILVFFSRNPQLGVGLGVGALLISLTDIPGNRADKFRAALISIVLFSATALLFSLNLENAWITAAAFTIVTFIGCMMAAFGVRTGAIGAMAIILSSFILGLQPQHPLEFSLYLCLGGCWFYAISLLQVLIWPYRSLHHAIYECLDSTASFLGDKACFYDPEISLDECYAKTINGHLRVSEKQQLVRSLLLGDKIAMRPDNRKGRQLLKDAIGVIGLYEQVTAIQFDYVQIRAQLEGTGSLELIIKEIELLATMTRNLSHTFLGAPKKSVGEQLSGEFHQTYKAISRLAKTSNPVTAKLLNNMLQNFQGIIAELDQINNPTAQLQKRGSANTAYPEFLGRRVTMLQQLAEHLNIHSTIFRFALRLSLSFLAGYGIIHLLGPQKYSYWLLLTLAIVARPRLSATWKRNVQRLWGTLAGLLISSIVLLLIPSGAVLLVIATIALTGFFAFNRTRYDVSVGCITIAVMICLSLYYEEPGLIFQGRIGYTIAGCGLAFLGVYLFPAWESGQLKHLVNGVLSSNLNFFKVATDLTQPAANRQHQGRLERKSAHLALARLSEALQHIKLEPGPKTHLKTIKKIQATSYRINGLITSIFLSDQVGKADQVTAISKQLGYGINAAFAGAEEENPPGDAKPFIKNETAVLKEGLELLQELSAELQHYFRIV